MTTLQVFPDAEDVARDWLLSISAVTTLVGQRISTKSPSSVVYPYLTLQRFGGVPTHRLRIDRASLQIAAWSDDEVEASLVARTARAAMHAISQYQHPTAVVTGVEDELGLGLQPDPLRKPPTPRYIFGVAIFLRPIP